MSGLFAQFQFQRSKNVFVGCCNLCPPRANSSEATVCLGCFGWMGSLGKYLNSFDGDRHQCHRHSGRFCVMQTYTHFILLSKTIECHLEFLWKYAWNFLCSTSDYLRAHSLCICFNASLCSILPISSNNIDICEWINVKIWPAQKINS